MTWSTANVVKTAENNEKLIGPSGMEILKKEIDGLQEFKKSRTEEQYKQALKNLARKWFQIEDNEFNKLRTEQITALEILADQRTKNAVKIWIGTNIIFITAVSLTSFLVSPYFLFGFSALAYNLTIADYDLDDHWHFRRYAKKLNKKFDPKLLVETKEP